MPGGISIVIWTLTIIVAIKYALPVLPAHNDVTAPTLSRLIVPLTVLLLTMPLAIQSRDTTGIGRVFGPILIL
jgi:K+ transporter